MSNINILEIIEKYNLSILRVPDKVTETYDIRHYKDGDEIITMTIDKVAPEFKNSFVKNFPDGRQFCRRYSVPKNAGKYMVKSVNDTGSIVKWNANTDNLADTLENSIKLFLSKNSSKQDLI